MPEQPSSSKTPSRRITTICRRLEKVYGPVEPPAPLPVLDELIATILSQNTSDSNSGPAFDALVRRFPDWDSVRRAPVKRIAAAIRRAGLANRKAPRIKQILNEVHRQRGELSLDFLAPWPAEDAYKYLRSFPGVGPKTAACVLLFACGQPVLPVDTHVHRVSRRLGLIGPETSAERAHDELAAMVPKEKVLEFHIQLIRHGRTTCAAAKPDCPDCVLLDLCEEGADRVAALSSARKPSTIT